MRNFIGQALLVDGPDLLQKNDGIAVKSMRRGVHFDMGGQLRFLNLGGNGGYDNRWTEAVSDVVLYDENRTDSPLLRADNRGQIGKKHISAFNDQPLHPAYETA